MKKVLQIKKLLSFTLMEMIVVMAITSIVIVITLLAYSIINKQFIDFQRQSTFVNTTSQFINTFENDLFRSQQITIGENVILIQTKTNQFSYQINEHEIIRQTENKYDTLINSILQIRMDFNNLDPYFGSSTFNFMLSQDTLVYKTYFSRGTETIK